MLNNLLLFCFQFPLCLYEDFLLIRKPFYYYLFQYFISFGL